MLNKMRESLNAGMGSSTNMDYTDDYDIVPIDAIKSKKNRD